MWHSITKKLSIESRSSETPKLQRQKKEDRPHGHMLSPHRVLPWDRHSAPSSLSKSVEIPSKDSSFDTHDIQIIVTNDEDQPTLPEGDGAKAAAPTSPRLCHGHLDPINPKLLNVHYLRTMATDDGGRSPRRGRQAARLETSNSLPSSPFICAESRRRRDSWVMSGSSKKRPKVQHSNSFSMFTSRSRVQRQFSKYSSDVSVIVPGDTWWVIIQRGPLVDNQDFEVSLNRPDVHYLSEKKVNRLRIIIFFKGCK